MDDNHDDHELQYEIATPDAAIERTTHEILGKHPTASEDAKLIARANLLGLYMVAKQIGSAMGASEHYNIRDLAIDIRDHLQTIADYTERCE